MSQQQIDDFINKLSKENKSFSWVINEIKNIEELSSYDFDSHTFSLLGLGIEINKNNQICLKTKNTDIKNEIFCVVDIESTGSIKNGQILEIGAVKIQNFKEIDRFESLIQVDNIPENITELTGITQYMSKEAPSLKFVLNNFRLFLKDSIFVAHNVRFDYNFLSKVMQENDFGVLLNRRLCTIDLAKKCIDSPKYGLETLKEFLNIQNQHHRALNDALAASEILIYCIKKIPFYIKTTEELLQFSKQSKNKTKKK
ncbi:3'-5' exonuclease [Campylobacter insulaenigrae]|uniref:DNA polymerase III, epsilon subunit n=1 Tax=Campylobacter insulaenigrae NCTC 12927 TaxID=1031564 RepID=A0A0A8H1A3_9BACT|nr:3'-5' exonuclease [Campylobacter insulaenigrae]AJC87953.1 DNA polymerase III, epsilon subunit [Campylobacter insulaenigrae NCTC 12927]VEH94455.1 DNA polymerase III subunit epsilon [Campylobacter insulaenigrae]